MVGKNQLENGSQGPQKRRRRKSSKQESSETQYFFSQNEKPKRRFPTEEALQLSDQLKRLSQEKKLDDALSLFWDSSKNNIRDGHHACIMVDLAARCGKVLEGEILLGKIEKQGMHISMETRTALLKGLCHSGKIGKAHELFISMCNSKVQSDYPNVRTLNTLLRGCLWSATTPSITGNIVGGVVTAEIAWEKYKSLHVSDKHRVGATFDVSSYEYSITLLCQALRVNDANRRISEMMLFFGVSEKKKTLLSSDDQSLTEGLAMAYCVLSRAYTILKMKEEAITASKKSLHFAKLSKDALKRGSSFSRKRGWKESKKGRIERRVESNYIYRNHRLSEIETESRTLMNIWQDVDTTNLDSKNQARELARRLITRLVFLSGGGTTCTTDRHDNQGGRDWYKVVQRDLLNSLYFSNGLATTLNSLNISIDKKLQILKRKDCNRILGGVGLQGGILRSDGTLDLHRIFSAGIGISTSQKKRKSKTRRVEVELGAGFGDWIVRKAIEDPCADFIAVELRADRVGQIFSRAAVLSNFKSVDNLCVIGAESRNLLRNHVSKECIDAIYVNHPEPPTQTFGAESTNLISIMEGGEEPAHMLNSDTIMAVGKALKRMTSSRFVVVTDNFWYARLICATIEKAIRQNPGQLSAVDLANVDCSHSFTKVETNLNNSGNSVLMFKGKPNETIGYPSASTGRGESYFDRLWRAGAGKHAETQDRYIIVLSPSNAHK